MLHHHFRELVTPTPVRPVAGCPGFLPVPLAGLVAAGQLAAVQEVYRLAAEQTSRQLADIVRPIPEFSHN